MIILILILLFIISIAIKYSNNQNKFAAKYVALSDVDYMDGHDFEYYCADLLKYDGFSHISVTKGSNDQGVDIVAYRDGQKYAIQCKRYNNALGNKSVQEVNTGRTIYGCSQAIVLTNNYFTKGAIHAAKATGVILWDRRKLDSLIRAKQRGVITKSYSSVVSIANNGEKNKLINYLCIGIVVLCFAIVIALGNGKSNKKDRERPKNETIPTEEHLELAESVASDSVSITITKMMFARHNGNLKYLDMVDDDTINCCVYATIENEGDSRLDLTRYNVVLVCDGIEYKQMLIDDSEFLFSHQSIAPNESLKGKVIDFQIPKNQQYSDSQIYIFFISPNGQQTNWQLR